MKEEVPPHQWLAVQPDPAAPLFVVGPVWTHAPHFLVVSGQSLGDYWLASASYPSLLP